MLAASENEIAKHIIDPDDIEINEFEFKLVMGDSWEHLNIYIESIFCTCSASNKKIIDYKIYLTELNDVILKGKCRECKTIAARHIETEEKDENFIGASRIKEIKKVSS